MKFFAWALATAFLYPACQPAIAFEVYSWVDENGVTHFSQWAPAEEVADLRVVETPGDTSSENPDGIVDIYSVEAVAEQTQAVWDEIERRREARRARQQPPASPVAQQITVYQEYAGIPYWYTGRPARPPDRPSRPGPPGAGEGPSLPLRPPRN